VQLDVLGVGAEIARHEVQLGHGHVEFVPAGVFELKEFSLVGPQGHAHEPQVAADAVLFVHHGARA